MSGLTFKLKQDPEQRCNLSALTPSKLNGKSLSDIEKIKINTTRVALCVGDIFVLSGTQNDHIVLEGGSDKLDYIGRDLDGGEMIIEGDVGAYAGRKMQAGNLTINGNTQDYLGSALAGGTVIVHGDAGEFVAAPKSGERFGMTSGTIVVTGSIGNRAGDRMRRGTIISHKTFGAEAASRMMGGTLWAAGGFGDHPGILMRRGTLIAPSAKKILPTFNDCGQHNLLILGLLQRHLSDVLGSLAPPTISHTVQRYSGDTATIGKGELLIFQ